MNRPAHTFAPFAPLALALTHKRSHSHASTHTLRTFLTVRTVRTRTHSRSQAPALALALALAVALEARALALVLNQRHNSQYISTTNIAYSKGREKERGRERERGERAGLVFIYSKPSKVCHHANSRGRIKENIVSASSLVRFRCWAIGFLPASCNSCDSQL